MKIFDCSMYFNESIISLLKIKENNYWIDETHITESNRTFKNKIKKYTFPYSKLERVRYHQYDASKVFKSGLWNLKTKQWFLNKRNCHWYNEAMQRNYSTHELNIKDNDIVIISDIDEIIDSRLAKKLIHAVLSYGIITIQMRLTHYYLNLYVSNWPGPQNYSYRTFIMTGKYYKNMKYTPDQLRKLGESGSLINKVHCFNEFAGFHHSWVGSPAHIAQKIYAYSHDINEHNELIFDQNNNINYQKILELKKQNLSVFPGINLYLSNEIQKLKSISELENLLKEYIL